MKMRRFGSLFVALAFLVAWLPGVAKAIYIQEWDNETNFSFNATSACKDPSGNILIVGEGGGKVYAQKVSPAGDKLFGEADKLVLQRSEGNFGSDNLTAVCLPDSSLFIVGAVNGTLYEQKVSSSGEPQWGLDAENTWGKSLGVSDYSASLAALPLSADTVAVAYSNGTSIKLGFIDTADGSANFQVVASGSKVKLVKAFANDRVWVVVDNRTALNVYIVNTAFEKTEFNQSITESLNKFEALTDGDGGVVTVFDDNGTAKYFWVDKYFKAENGTLVDSGNLTAATFVEGGDTDYIAIAYDNGTNATQEFEIGNSTAKWTYELPATPDVMADLGSGVVGYLWVDRNLTAQVVAEIEGSPSGLLGENGTSLFSATKAVALLPGSAYAVANNGILKFSWDAKPDLKFASSTLNDVSATLSTEENGTITVNATIENVGEVSASNIPVSFYLTDNNTSLDTDCKVFLASETIAGPLGPSANETLNATIEVPASTVNEILKCADFGTSVYLAAVINEDGSIAESNSTNNSAFSSTLDGNITAPDLQITIAQLSANETDAGNTVNATVTVSNNGSATAADVEVAFYLNCGSNNWDLGSHNIGSLENGTSDNYTFEIQIPADAAGSCNVTAEVDPDNLIGESKDNNNSANYSISITGHPNFMIPAFVISPTSASAGETVMVSCAVQNNGVVAAASPVTLSFFLSQDETLGEDDIPLGSVVVPSLAAGEDYTENLFLTIPNDAAPGSYRLLAVVDPDNEVAEAYENDNLAFYPFTVSGTGVILPTVQIATDCEGGYAKVMVAVPNCGDYCGYFATVAIQADINGDDVIDYSWTPSGWFYGWQEGAEDFVYQLDVVPAVSLLDTWMGVPCEAVAGGTVTLSVTVGDQTVTDTATFPAE